MLEKTLESPLDCKEISSGISLEGMMLKLKFQYFGLLMRRVDSLEKTLMLGGIGGRRRRGRQRMRWLDGITDLMDVSLSELGSWWWTGRPGVLQFTGSQSQTRLSDWTELIRAFKIVQLNLILKIHVFMFILEYDSTTLKWQQLSQHCYSNLIFKIA